MLFVLAESSFKTTEEYTLELKQSHDGSVFLVVLNVVGVAHKCRLFCTFSIYTRPTLASPMAPHTSKTNSSGKAKSPKVSSKASANSSGFFLSFPSSTMVAAEDMERGQRTFGEHKTASDAN